MTEMLDPIPLYLQMQFSIIKSVAVVCLSVVHSTPSVPCKYQTISNLSAHSTPAALSIASSSQSYGLGNFAVLDGKGNPISKEVNGEQVLVPEEKNLTLKHHTAPPLKMNETNLASSLEGKKVFNYVKADDTLLSLIAEEKYFFRNDKVSRLISALLLITTESSHHQSSSQPATYQLFKDVTELMGSSCVFSSHSRTRNELSNNCMDSRLPLVAVSNAKTVSLQTG
jgi:hypothetical protein